MPNYTIKFHSYYELREDMLKEIDHRVKFALSEDYGIVVIIKSIEKTRGGKSNDLQIYEM